MVQRVFEKSTRVDILQGSTVASHHGLVVGVGSNNAVVAGSIPAVRCYSGTRWIVELHHRQVKSRSAAVDTMIFSVAQYSLNQVIFQVHLCTTSQGKLIISSQVDHQVPFVFDPSSSSVQDIF